MKETKEINKVNRFQCTYDNCRRILNREGIKSFPCTMCGHGQMRLVKPKAYCKSCGMPIYDNVDTRVPSTWHSPHAVETVVITVTCANCVNSRVNFVAMLEEEVGKELIREVGIKRIRGKNEPLGIIRNVSDFVQANMLWKNKKEAKENEQEEM